MLDLQYLLVIEATEDPTFFGFLSPDLEGFTGTGHSIEDCLHHAKLGMDEHNRASPGAGPAQSESDRHHSLISLDRFANYVYVSNIRWLATHGSFFRPGRV